MKKSSFFEQVYQMVRQIPEGKVATYGQIAKLLSTRDARRVGWALHANTDKDNPCHRVVNKDGQVALNYAFEGWQEQKRKLMEEGVKFVDEMRVDLGLHLWPRVKLN